MDILSPMRSHSCLQPQNWILISWHILKRVAEVGITPSKNMSRAWVSVVPWRVQLAPPSRHWEEQNISKAVLRSKTTFALTATLKPLSVLNWVKKTYVMPIIDPTGTELPISLETIWREVQFLGQGLSRSPFYDMIQRRATKVFRTGRSFSEIAQFSEDWVDSDGLCDHLAKHHLHNHDFQLVRFEYSPETGDGRPYILVHESEEVFRWVFDCFGMHESLLYHFIYDTAGIVQYNTTQENSTTLQFF